MKDFRILESRFLLIGIFVFSLLIRIIYFYQLKSTSLFGLFSTDSVIYDQYALEILKGHFTSSQIFNPHYSFFLSFIYMIFGHSLTSVALCQIILDSLTCVFLYQICIHVFHNKSIGLLTSIIYACYSTAIFYTGFVLDTTLVIFLNVLLILMLLQAKAKGRFVLWLSSGIILGLTLLIRENIILFLPCLILWLFFIKEKKASALIPIFIGVLIVLLPSSIKNYVVEGSFSPFSSRGGIHFYIANNPHANGSNTILPNIPSSPTAQVEAIIYQTKKEIKKELTSEQISNYWFLKGLQFIKNNKRRYVMLSFKKMFLFWNSQEIALNLNYYFCKQFLPILNFPLFSFGLIGPLAILGIVFVVRQKLTDAYLIILMICVYMAALTIGFVSARYRLPAVPFMIILSAYSIHHFWQLTKFSKIRELILFAMLLIVFFVMMNKRIIGINPGNNFSVSHTNLEMFTTVKIYLKRR